MKVNVTRDFVINVAKNEPLTAGIWFRQRENGCAACLIGNTFMKLSPKKEWGKLQHAIVEAISSEAENCGGWENVCAAGSSTEELDEERVLRGIATRQFNRVLSHLFESLPKIHHRKREVTREHRRELVRRIKKYLPIQFQLEVDGLELLKKLPAGVSRID